ncbi:CehA/McbA family metallohydrolase [Acidobacteria bacterium AH-259-O06]|nr:CehA/McbA family metallohydrolase [Acidobacteria bacterium AH-259-O06]
MKIIATSKTMALCLCAAATIFCVGRVLGHGHTLHKFEKARQLAQARAAALAEKPTEANTNRKTCQLTINLMDAKTKKSLPGLVRIINVSQAKAIKLAEMIERNMNWYAMPSGTTITVPQTKLKIAAFQGLETEKYEHEVDLTGMETANVRLPLKRFYKAAAKGLRSGNTHLHLMKLTKAEADRYLRVVPKADGLDLVFVSYLRRLPEERDYISNTFTSGDLKRLSQDGALFGNGEEHRHNFGRGGEGYGHVMLLDILKLIQPVSIGPGIMGKGTDGIPLQRGIKAARGHGASVIWCHNNFGFEDIPNWMAGLLDAQNIFDGGSHGTYEDTYYRYLNLGMKIPFSTGTDWFIYDFSRVYVPIDGELTSKSWLRALTAGRSYITNGTFLEFQVGDSRVGDTIAMAGPGQLQITGHAIGRNDFQKIELVHNGKVIHSIGSQPAQGHFTAEMKYWLDIGEPGWVALRIPLKAGENEFGKDLYAHTSPIYVELAGKRIYRPQIAQELIAEMEQSIEVIKAKGKFANDAQREAVLKVYRDGIGVVRKHRSFGF